MQFFRISIVFFRPSIHLALHFGSNAFHLWSAQPVLFRSHTISVFYLFGDNLTIDAIADIGFLFLTDKGGFAFRLVLQGTVDNHVRLGHPFKPTFPGVVLPIQADAAQVVRVILDMELAVGVLHAPLMVGYAGTFVHLIRQLLPADGNLYAGVGEGGGAFRPDPEDIYHVVNRHHIRLLVHALLVHLDTRDAGRRVFGLVPCLASFGIVDFQFFQGKKFVLVFSDKLQVRVAAFFFGGDIHSGKPPVFVQLL